eukprot:gene7731-5421_t
MNISGKAPHIKVFTGNVIHLSTTTSSHPSLHSSCCSHGLVHRHQVLHFHWRLRTHRDTHRRAENGVEEILGPRVSDTNERRTSLSGNQTKEKMAVHSSRRSAEICAESHYSILFITKKNILEYFYFNFFGEGGYGKTKVDKGLHYDIIIFLSKLLSTFIFCAGVHFFSRKYIYIYIYIYIRKNRGTGLQYRCIRGSDNSVTRLYSFYKLLTPGRTDTVTILSSTMEEKYKIIHSFTKKVFLIQRHEDGALFVMKRVPKHSIQEIDLLSSESEEKEEDNQELKHDIAVDEKIHGDSPEAQNNEEGSDVKKRHDWNGEYVEVIFEYGSGGDLKKLLRERHERWREEMSQRRAQKSYQKADQNTLKTDKKLRITETTKDEALFFCPMVKALHYLHSHKVFHKDIKPENVFICWDGT